MPEMTPHQLLTTLNAKRKALDMTYQDVANRAGMERTNVSATMRRVKRKGKRPGVTAETLCKLADAVDMVVTVQDK